MSEHTLPHPSWEDLAKVLKLIDLYVDVETQTCNPVTLSKLNALSSEHSIYNDPASFIRFVIYPQFMASIGCTSGRHEIGVGSAIIYAWDYPDADLFFHEMASDWGMRITYSQVASIMCRDDTDTDIVV